MSLWLASLSTAASAQPRVRGSLSVGYGRLGDSCAGCESGNLPGVSVSVATNLGRWIRPRLVAWDFVSGSDRLARGLVTELEVRITRAFARIGAGVGQHAVHNPDGSGPPWSGRVFTVAAGGQLTEHGGIGTEAEVRFTQGDGTMGSLLAVSYGVVW